MAALARAGERDPLLRAERPNENDLARGRIERDLVGRVNPADMAGSRLA
jgi:hypothetical protein